MAITRIGCAVCVMVMVWVSVGIASADVFNMPSGQTSMSLVPVGNPGNASDPRVSSDSTSGYGSLGYNYNISKFETTIGQYTQFLNAVAATDTYGLYNPNMASNLNIAGITRSGSNGSYSYSAIGSPNRPVTYVSWGDAARFANWVTNGQPTGAQNASTTEDGSYLLNGATSLPALNAVTRKPGASFVIPTENEWYKASYYDPTIGGSNYWQFSMRTDVTPYSAQPPGSDAPNAAFSANFYNYDFNHSTNDYDNGYAVTSSTSFSSTQNYLTDVGAYTSAVSYYGTFDQGGNVFEWNEAIVSASYRGIRGGSFLDDDRFYLKAGERSWREPQDEFFNIGFRVSEVPEPASASLIGFGGLLLVMRRK